MKKDKKPKESKAERDARIEYSQNGRKMRTRVIPNKKKDHKYDYQED